jgi:mono/diheme cytochrome c family protein
MHVRWLMVVSSLLVAAGTATAQSSGAPDAEALYKSTCMPCHMADGNAALEPMNFVDGKWKHGSSVKEVANTITNGVPGTAMMPFKTRFSEQEILALAKYVRHFDKNLKAAPSKAGAKKKKTS